MQPTTYQMHERVIERKVKNGLATSSMHMHARVHAWCTRTLINICICRNLSYIFQLEIPIRIFQEKSFRIKHVRFFLMENSYRTVMQDGVRLPPRTRLNSYRFFGHSIKGFLMDQSDFIQISTKFFC